MLQKRSRSSWERHPWFVQSSPVLKNIAICRVPTITEQRINEKNVISQ